MLDNIVEQENKLVLPELDAFQQTIEIPESLQKTSDPEEKDEEPIIVERKVEFIITSSCPQNDLLKQFL